MKMGAGGGVGAGASIRYVVRSVMKASITTNEVPG